MCDAHVREAWTRELDRIEAGLEQARSLGADGPVDAEMVDQLLESQAWTPPPMPGPIPLDLIERAQGLLRSADEARTRLIARLASLRNEQGFAERVSETSPTRGAGTPVYLDITA